MFDIVFLIYVKINRKKYKFINSSIIYFLLLFGSFLLSLKIIEKYSKNIYIMLIYL